MKIAIEGCAHGELQTIYDTIAEIERRECYKVDLLLCCGDFQSTRNLDDLNCMAIPKKFHDMCSFYKYYSGELVAPILTIFIGGNHEASNYLQELPYGGWVAPNIYYMGYAGVVQVNGVRIGGVSGIYKGFDYYKGHYEMAPYDDSTKRSVYHIRQLEVFRMKQLSSKIDIMMSHDWPRGVYDFGDSDQLCRFKPHFRDEIASKKLGSPPCEDLLNHLRPDYWFSAHLHCKFAAVVPHQNPEGTTKFLALDKCLPKRRFLQILDIPNDDASGPATLNFDIEWLTILCITKHLIDVKSTTHYMPGPGSPYRFNFTPTEDEKSFVLEKMSDNLLVPLNFTRTAEPFNPQQPASPYSTQPNAQLNPQTTALCERLDIDDPVSLVMLTKGLQLNHSTYRDKPADLDDSNQSNTTDSSFNASIECVNVPKKRSQFTLPAPMNASNDNPENLSLLDADDDNDDVDTTKDDRDFVVEDICSIDPTSMNSTLSTSFTLVRPEETGVNDESAVGEINSSLTDVASLLSSAVKIESPRGESANPTQVCGEEGGADISGPISVDATNEDEKNCPTKEADASDPEGKSPPKKFKRRNQAIYAATEDEV